MDSEQQVKGPAHGSTAASPLSMRIAAKLAVFGLVCAFLYVAKPILLPIALATFFTFVFAPIVRRLQLFRLPRALAVLCALGGAAGLLFTVSWFGYKQLAALANELPAYRTNIVKKIADIRSLGRESPIERVTKTVESISEEAEEIAENEEEEEEDEGKPEIKAEPVEVVVMPREDPLGLSRVTAFRPVAGYAGTAGLVLILTYFFLYYREDLRNRLLSFAGEARLIVTNRALDDAGTRISRYLLAQAIVNAVYGVVAGLGFWALGVPYALLWGVASFLLRYIPYVGPIAAAVPPIASAFIMSDGWITPLSVAGFIVVLELLSNNVMEPWLYGRSAGLSEVAIIISAVVWAFIWGPIGLVLATPLSVCIVVLGRFVPGLNFLSRLMGSDPAMDPATHFYHRLVSRDSVEARDIVKNGVAQRGFRETVEELVIPALALAARDFEAGRMTIEEADEVAESALSVTEDLKPTLPEDGAPQDGDFDSLPLVVGLPAGGTCDSAALELFAAGRPECRWRLVERGVLAAELVEALRSEPPAAVCITALSERSFLRARRWCKQMLREVESQRIVVGLWGIDLAGELPGPGIPVPEGSELATSASETWKLLQPWLTLETPPPGNRAEQDAASVGPDSSPATALRGDR